MLANTTMKPITEAEFEAEWGVSAGRDGSLLTFEEANRHPLNCIWTVVETGDDIDRNWYAIPGVHLVNRLGYVSTAKHWTDETLQAVYFQDDIL